MVTASLNYFELFNLDQSYRIDESALEDSYHRLQQENHPDKFAGESESIKMQAVQKTSIINSAYETLKSPLHRAGYLLELQEVNVEAVTQADLGMDLLMEQMQMREALAELPKDESSLAQLDELKHEVNGKIADREVRFVTSLDSNSLPEAKKLFHEMQFLFKLLTEIDAGEELRLGY